jgi:hypothetical protein
MFRYVPPGVPVTAPTNANPSPRAVTERRAAELLHELVGLAVGTTRLRVAASVNGLACLVQVWSAGSMLPTVREESAVPVAPVARKRTRGGREQCRADVLAAVRAAGGPLTRKEVVRALRTAGAGHGPGTIAKALADLTQSKTLLNRRDKRGYRLPEWVRRHPTLFDAEPVLVSPRQQQLPADGKTDG